MAGTKEIKRRIKSVKSTKKITKAMELVAASKMKRAVASTFASRPYSEYSWEILTSIAKNAVEISNPFFMDIDKKGARKNILLLVISSNRGLCGAYNAQVIKKSFELIKRQNNSAKIDIITIGKKGDVALRRIGENIVASFFELPDNINTRDVLPLSKFVIDEYTNGSYDKVLVVYTDFLSALVQKPNIRQILPIQKAELAQFVENLENNSMTHKGAVKEEKNDYLFEGDFYKLIGVLAEKITRMQIYQMLLESNASEQSSRMVAMKNASDASGEMIDDLTLAFNKARQANITREISEISAGMASVS